MRLPGIIVLCLLGAMAAPGKAGAVSEQDVLEQAGRELLILFKPQTDTDRRADLCARIGAVQVRVPYGGRFSIAALPAGRCAAALRMLARHPAVACAEPNAVVQACAAPDDPDYPRQWHFSMINLAAAWQYGIGDGVVVAVLDSGINPNGRDGFGGRVLSGYNALLDLPLRWQDFNGHGTHVAGTIGQETGNSRGCAGVAPAASLLPVKVLGRLGYGTRAALAAGIVWATDHGAQIINMSLGETEPSEAVRDAVAYAHARGVTMIAAAGNDSDETTLAPVRYPAAFPQVIAVAAVDATGTRAWYSNAGPEIVIAAPGGDTRADGDRDGYPDGVVQETFETGMGFVRGAIGWRSRPLQGTSMAAPHVAGTAALIKALRPDWGPDEIKQALTHTAVDLGAAGGDVRYGAGLLDAAAAVSLAAEGAL